MDALVIIDFQRNIADGTPAYRLEECRDLLAKAAAHARASGAPVIFVQHEGEGEWEKGSPGWQFFDELAPQPGDRVVAKQSCDGFRQTDLTKVLAEVGAGGIVVGGYATDYCVDATVKAGAAQIGVRTTVLKDAHTCPDRAHLPAASIVQHHNIVWGGWDNPGNPIQLITTAEFLAR